MSGEKEPIRASRLSNREVMLSAAVLHSLNQPSTSGQNKCENRLSSISSEAIDKSTDKTESSSKQTTADMTSPSKSNTDDTETNIDDELSLSQYELDIVNKYLNQLDDSDESNDEIVSEKLDEQLAIASSIDSSDELNHINATIDQCNGIDKSIDSDAQSESIEKSSQISSSSSSLQQPPSSVSYANANAIDEMQCTQTSRQFGMIDPENAMINQTIRNTESAHSHYDTHNDVNNNNISLSSNVANQSLAHGRYTNDSQRHCDNNNMRRTNQNRTASSNINRITANLPIVVGITSCVWGLFFYAVKSLYSDLT